MPEGPYPPVVLDYEPHSGQEVAPDTAITLRFDQPMDRKSVEAAFTIVPAVEGEFTWMRRPDRVPNDSHDRQPRHGVMQLAVVVSET